MTTSPAEGQEPPEGSSAPVSAALPYGEAPDRQSSARGAPGGQQPPSGQALGGVAPPAGTVSPGGVAPPAGPASPASTALPYGQTPGPSAIQDLGPQAPSYGQVAGQQSSARGTPEVQQPPSGQALGGVAPPAGSASPSGMFAQAPTGMFAQAPTGMFAQPPAGMAPPYGQAVAPGFLARGGLQPPGVLPPPGRPRIWASVTALVLLLISLVPNVLDLFTVMVHGSELFPGDSLPMVIVGELVSTGMVAAVIGAILAALRRPTGLVLVSALVMVGMYPDFLGFNQADYSYSLMGLPSAIIGLIILLLRFTAGILLLLAGPRDAGRCPVPVLLSRGAAGTMCLVALEQVVNLVMTLTALGGLADKDKYFTTMYFWFRPYIMSSNTDGTYIRDISTHQDMFSLGAIGLVAMGALALAALVLMGLRRAQVLSGVAAALAACAVVGFNAYRMVTVYADTNHAIAGDHRFTVPVLMALVVLGFAAVVFAPGARSWFAAPRR